MRGFLDDGFQREVDIRNIARENGLDNNKPQTPDRTPLHFMKAKREELFGSGAHSHGKVTFGRAQAARPEYALPQLKPNLTQSSVQDLKAFSNDFVIKPP